MYKELSLFTPSQNGDGNGKPTVTYKTVRSFSTNNDGSIITFETKVDGQNLRIRTNLPWRVKETVGHDID